MAYNRYAAVSDEARNVEIARIATVDEERDLQGRRIPGRVCVVGSGAPITRFVDDTNVGLAPSRLQHERRGPMEVLAHEP